MNKFLTLPPTVQLLCFGSLINRAGQMLVVFLTIYLTDELGYTETFASYCFGAFGFGAIFAALVGGHFADAIGRKVVMLAALVGGGVVLVAFSYLTDPLAILATIAGFAFISEMYRPASQAMIADLVSPEQRPHAFTLMYLAINLGFAVAPPIGAALIAWFSFKSVFWFDAATSLVFGVIILIFIRETLPARTPDRTDADSGDNPNSSNADQSDQIPWYSAVWHIACDYVFVVFCLGTFFVALVYLQGLSTLPLYVRRLGFGADDYGRIIMVNGIMIVLLQIPITSIVVKYNRAVVVALASLVSGVGFMLTDYADTAWEFRLTVMVWTTGEMMAMPLVAAIVADLAPLRMRARYMGVYTISYSGANMIAAPIGGMILVHFGGSVLWKTCFALGVASALLFASIGRSIATPKTEEPQIEKI
ncbi:MAG: MFS transporter [Phycisphaerae bacterium]|nr:MAG: MFS transporter [Phycisphaerae bacterium]